jgi:hypothetical protein
VRTAERDGERLVAIAVGYDSGFSTGWPAGSRLILDLLVDAWQRDPATAFAVARAAYPERAVPLIDDIDDLGGGPGASLAIARVLPDRVAFEWLGECGALVVRAGAVVARTRRHTLGETHPMAAGSPQAHVLVRSIGAYQPDAESETLELAWQRGDRIVLATGRVFDGLPDDDLAAVPTADRILTRAVALSPHRWGAVAAYTPEYHS